MTQKEFLIELLKEDSLAVFTLECKIEELEQIALQVITDSEKEQHMKLTRILAMQMQSIKEYVDLLSEEEIKTQIESLGGILK